MQLSYIIYIMMSIGLNLLTSNNIRDIVLEYKVKQMHMLIRVDGGRSCIVGETRDSLFIGRPEFLMAFWAYSATLPVSKIICW